jgi:hypothetical protein
MAFERERLHPLTSPAKVSKSYAVNLTMPSGPNTSHPDQQFPVTAAQSKTRRRAPESDIELMTKEKVLGFKLPPRLEHFGDEHS